MSTLNKVLISISAILFGALACLLIYLGGTGYFGKQKTDKEYQEQISELVVEIEENKSLIEQLELSNAQKTQDLEKERESKAQLQTQIDGLNEIISNDASLIVEINSQISVLQTQLANKIAENNAKAEDIAKLNEQISTLQAYSAQLQRTNELNIETIKMLNDQLSAQNSRIQELVLQIQNNSSDVSILNEKIAKLEKSLAFYEEYISGLESENQVVATFEVDGSVYNIQILMKGANASVVAPESTEYKVFGGWTVNGEDVDLTSYAITTNTKFVAKITYKYDVNFLADSEEIGSQIVVKNGYVSQVPTAPVKEGYDFDGYSVDGKTIVDPTTYPITKNTTFVAVYTQRFNVSFNYPGKTIPSQSIRNGELVDSSKINITSSETEIFNGWKFNNAFVDFTTFKITADIVFTADITYKHEVRFIVDGELNSKQYIVDGEHAVAPQAPTKQNAIFYGWSLDDKTKVDVANVDITDTTIFKALFGNGLMGLYRCFYIDSDGDTAYNGTYYAISPAGFMASIVNSNNNVEEVKNSILTADYKYKINYNEETGIYSIAQGYQSLYVGDISFEDNYMILTDKYGQKSKLEKLTDEFSFYDYSLSNFEKQTTTGSGMFVQDVNIKFEGFKCTIGDYNYDYFVVGDKMYFSCLNPGWSGHYSGWKNFELTDTYLKIDSTIYTFAE